MKRARKPNGPAKKLAGASPALLSSPPPSATAGRAFSQCLAAIDLLEVACRSLAHQEIGSEQAALRCTQQAMWVAHDSLFPLQDDSDSDDGDLL